MSKFNKTQTFTAAAAFGAAALFSMLSFGSTAEAAINLSSCQGNTAGKVASCCERLTAAQRPLWMIQSRTSCREAVVCRGRGGHAVAAIAAVPVKGCYIQVMLFEKEGGGGGEEGGGDRGRSPNDLR